MIEIKEIKEGPRRIGLEVKGHSDYARAGLDIICAAASALTQGALLALKKVARVKTETVRRDGYLLFKIIDGSEEAREKADIILQSAHVALKDLEKGYPAHIKLEE